MSKTKEPAKKEKSLTKNPPSAKKVLSLLSSEGVTKTKICKVLAEGLTATRPIVADGEIISREPDYTCRHKYVETILEVIGEKRLVVPQGDLHVHFTNVLQQIRAYERGDDRAAKAADRFIEASGEAQ